jgi:TolB protein
MEGTHMKRLVQMSITALALVGCDTSTQAVAPESTTPPTFARHPGTEVRLTFDAADHSRPRISGDRIVWQDYRNGDWDVYLYNFMTGMETRITSDSRHDTDPAISGDRIVWSDDSEIYLHDLTSGTTTQLTDVPGFQKHPDISGDHVVWEDYRTGSLGARIYLHDLGAGLERRLDDGSFPGPEYPAVSGDRIVWFTPVNTTGDWEVFRYDLTDDALSVVDANPEMQIWPDISGDRIVWQDHRNGNADIYMYDLATGTESQITWNTANQTHPAISGDRIVWEDDRNGQRDIYMYDLATGAEWQINSLPADARNPDIWGNRIVWEDNRYGRWDVFLFLLYSGTYPEIQIIQMRVETFSTDGSIDNPGVAESLMALLSQAQEHILASRNTAARHTLSAFITHVRTQADRHIHPLAAEALINSAQALIDGL